MIDRIIEYAAARIDGQMLKYNLDGIFDPARAHPDDAHSVLMRLIPPGSRVLELGCATGYLSGYMEQKLRCRVVGLEFDAGAAAVAANRCSEVHVVDLDAPGALEYASDSAPYDVLLAAAVLEHLKRPERLLYEARGLLRPGGILIASFPNVAHWRARLMLLSGRFDYAEYGLMDRTHLRFYTLRTGRQMLEAQGYEVRQTLIAGSGLQNALNSVARRLRREMPGLILPSLLAYELIYVATLLPHPTQAS